MLKMETVEKYETAYDSTGKVLLLPKNGKVGYDLFYNT